MRNFWRAIAGCSLAGFLLMTGLQLVLRVHVVVAHPVTDHGHTHDASSTGPDHDRSEPPDHGHDLNQVIVPAVTRVVASTAPVTVLTVALLAPWQAQPEITAAPGEILSSPTLPDPLPGYTVLLI